MGPILGWACLSSAPPAEPGGAVRCLLDAPERRDAGEGGCGRGWGGVSLPARGHFFPCLTLPKQLNGGEREQQQQQQPGWQIAAL